MNAAAAAAVDFKNGFSSQFNGLMQPFTDPDSLYSSYSTYNNWASKVPSPLGTKSFPWPVMPPTNHHHHHHHHHQNATGTNNMNCFNAATSSAVNSSGSMLPTAMTAMSATGLSTVSNPVVSAVTLPPQSCPYTSTHNPYSVYHHHRNNSSDPCAATIASFRLKAKQHADNFISGYTSPIRSNSNPNSILNSNSHSNLNSNSNPNPLSACQYAAISITSDHRTS